MSNQQLESSKKSLDNIKKVCDQDTVQYYCDCLTKMYMAFNKLEDTEMLSYIRQIMAPAFPIVVTCFEELVTEYMQTSSKVKKEKILLDIEKSVVEYANVFETIVHCTNSADRMVLQTTPLNIGLNYAAPKLCAYYSTLLNHLARLFAPGEDYFFCVYPCLSVTFECNILFINKKNSGKVSVARLPAKDIANVKHLRMCLCHELFHVLPRELRHRCARSYLFFQILLFVFLKRLLNGIDCLDAQEKKELAHYLFADLVDEIKEYGETNKAQTRGFYSSSLIAHYANSFQKKIANIRQRTADELFESVFWNENDYKDYQDYEKAMKKAEEVKRIIDINADMILISNDIVEMCDFYMEIFREGFADLFFVLVLRVKPERYLKEFDFDFDNLDEMNNRVLSYLRLCFVAETLVATENTNLEGMEEFLGEWRKWYHNHTEKYTSFLHAFAGAGKKSNIDEEESKKAGTIIKKVVLSKGIIELYREYFDGCCKEYVIYEKKYEHQFKQFRERFLIDQKKSTLDILYHIAKRQWEEL